jgi:hypothetical protein|tara:strand:- start:5338 stop:5472 length:135 start_codon:yes stop_codon:yes gene_type:complete
MTLDEMAKILSETSMGKKSLEEIKAMLVKNPNGSKKEERKNGRV